MFGRCDEGGEGRLGALAGEDGGEEVRGGGREAGGREGGRELGGCDGHFGWWLCGFVDVEMHWFGWRLRFCQPCAISSLTKEASCLNDQRSILP